MVKTPQQEIYEKPTDWSVEDEVLRREEAEAEQANDDWWVFDD